MADSCRSPLLLSGDICPYLVATVWCVAFSAAPRPVNRPLSRSPIRVNNLFAILFQKLFGPPGRDPDQTSKMGMKPRDSRGLPQMGSGSERSNPVARYWPNRRFPWQIHIVGLAVSAIPPLDQADFPLFVMS